MRWLAVGCALLSACGGSGGESIPPGREVALEAQTGRLRLGGALAPMLRVEGFWLHGDQVSRDDGETWEALSLAPIRALERLNDDAVVLERETGLGLLAISSGTFFDWAFPPGGAPSAWTAGPALGALAVDPEGRSIYGRADGEWAPWAEIPWAPEQLSNVVRGFLEHAGELYVASDRIVHVWAAPGEAPRELELPPGSSPVDRWFSVPNGLIVETGAGVFALEGGVWQRLEGFDGRREILACPDGSFLHPARFEWRPSLGAEWATISEWVIAPSPADLVATCDSIGAVVDTGTSSLLVLPAGAERWTFIDAAPVVGGEQAWGTPIAFDGRWLASGLFRVGARWDDDAWVPAPSGLLAPAPDGTLLAAEAMLESVDGLGWVDGGRSAPGSIVAVPGGPWIAQVVEGSATELSTTTTARIFHSEDQGTSWALVHESERVCGPGGCSGELHTFDALTSGGELVGPEFESLDLGVTWAAHEGWARNEDWPSRPTIAGVTDDDELMVLDEAGPFDSRFDALFYADAGRGPLRGRITVVLEEESEVRTFHLDDEDHLVGWSGRAARRVVRSAAPLP